MHIFHINNKSSVNSKIWLLITNILQVNLECNFNILFKIVGGARWLVLNYFK
jgi:hypothetical protein